MDHILAFGSNSYGQLAVGNLADVSNPSICKFEDAPSVEGPYSIAAGGNHTLLLDAQGRLWAAGRVSDGRAGAAELTTNDQSAIFIRVRLKDVHGDEVTRFQFVSATWEASIFVTSAGHLYTSGQGPKGELGHGIEQPTIQEPRMLADFPPAGSKIIDISGSMSHTVAVLSNGDVYGWGNGRKSQLGRHAELVWRPRKIDDVAFRALKAVCGRDFSFVVGDPEDGKFIVLGQDKYQLQSSAPESVKGWKTISASWCSIHILFNNGTLLSWGRNDHGQLAPSDLPSINSCVAGSEHVLARTVDGRVLAWGWGEHGNCGPNATEGTAMTISHNQDCHLVGAGCATSFITNRDAEK